MPTTRLNKTEVISALADKLDTDRKSIGYVLDALVNLASEELRKGNEFVIPGMLKIRSVVKPATVDREAISPFTKLPTTIKGKPASKKVKMAAVKAFKDSVQG